MPDTKVEHPQIVFLDRVRKLPLMNAAYEYSASKYCTVREYHPMLKSVMERAEKSVQYAAETSTPVLQTFKLPIGIADSVACKALDFVETRVPIVKKSPVEIATDTKKGMESRLKPRVDFIKDKLASAKLIGEDRANAFLATPYGQQLKSKVETLLDNTGYYLDSYAPVPKGGGEYLTQSVSAVKPGDTQEKARLLSAKVQRLIVLHSQAQLRNLSRVLQALTALRDQAIGYGYKAQTKAVEMYGGLVKRSKEEGTLEYRLLKTAEHLMFTVKHTLVGLVGILPTSAQDLIQKAFDNVNALYEIIQKNKLRDIPAELLAKVQEQVKDLYNYLGQAASSIWKTKELSNSPVKKSN